MDPKLAMLGKVGPCLEDFISANASELPSLENVVEYCIFVDCVSGQAAMVEALRAVRQDVLALVAEVCGREAGTPNRGVGSSGRPQRTCGACGSSGGGVRAGRARGRSDPCLRRRGAPAWAPVLRGLPGRRVAGRVAPGRGHAAGPAPLGGCGRQRREFLLIETSHAWARPSAAGSTPTPRGTGSGSAGATSTSSTRPTAARARGLRAEVSPSGRRAKARDAALMRGAAGPAPGAQAAPRGRR